MNLKFWEYLKGFWKWLFDSKRIVDKLEEITETLAPPKPPKYVRVKKGERRYVLGFTETTKKVPDWVRRKNLGRLTKKEMPCLS